MVNELFVGIAPGHFDFQVGNQLHKKDQTSGMYAQESMNMSWCMKSSWGPRIATQYVGTWNEIRLCAFLTPKLWGHFAGCLRQGWGHWGLAICVFKTDIYKVSFLVVAGGWYPKGGTLAPKDAQRRNSVGMLNSSHVLFTFYFMYVF